MRKKYGLFTAISMIVGIVIGSGIFFKADDILFYTRGSVLGGVVLFCVAAISIIFGSLTIAALARLSEGEGGIIDYAARFVSRPFGCAIGWFQFFLYYPSLIAVVAFAAAAYLCMLFNIEASLLTTAFLAALLAALFFALNIIAPRVGGGVQNVCTLLKLVPIIVISVIGFFVGKPHELFAAPPSLDKLLGASGALLPVAFSFDGWIVATAIGREIKNSRRNLPLALIIAPLIALMAYLSYFVALCAALGTDAVTQLQNEAPFYAARLIFGAAGASLLTLFVTISVLGTLNGLILGYIRIPHALTARAFLPPSFKIGAAATVCSIWCAFNAVALHLSERGDVSEIIIAISYGTYIFLYVACIKLWRKKRVSGILFPSLAILGSAAIISGAIAAPHFFFFFALCAATLLAGFFYSSLDRGSEDVYNLARGDEGANDI